MILMLAKKRSKKSPVNEWSVYIVECSDGTYYCGATKDINKRVKKHNTGTGAKYTRPRRPVKIIAHKGNMTKSQALSLEYKVKQQPRKNKIEFLESFVFHSII